MSKSSSSTKELLSEIDHLKKQMIFIGSVKGLSHPETLSYSEKLDKLIFIYQKHLI